MKDKSFKEFYEMISDAVNIFTYNGKSDNGIIIECATRMYIEQMRIKAYGPTGYSEQHEAVEDLDNYE